MPQITLPDGSIKSFDHPVSVMEVAQSIGSGLAKATIAGKVNGRLVDASDLIALAATDTAAPLRQRIRLLETPEDATTVRVLGKRKCPAFTGDNDQPPVRGMENLLIAMAQGDMLERERQYGKANLKFQEGVALLNQFKAEETIQQAHNQRIIPDSGFGDPSETLWR